MKKVKLTGKLYLNKETIANLNDEQMTHIHGGEAFVSIYYCKSKRQACDPGPDTLDVSLQVTCNCCTGGLCNTCDGY
ncbi:class I lanthipeptide [Williamwhitmania taraxaci]|uniref:Natural product n=1 Tax=Williamwhitmania taraxaci TaxID=1640674 RepID=A0A1G6S131_9BACT|nr:class I lanthipeptide [Williamwhitmania taraxaci]SDD09895.1 hypothetical protein SAMN05216323_10846 [Williamwhitmania taraxaci]